MKKFASLLMALTLALALLTGCGNAAQDTASDSAASQATAAPESTAAAQATEAPDADQTAQEDSQEQDKITVTFNVTDEAGNTTPFELTCQDGATLADALLEAGLISQEEHDAGYITVVNGVEANWDDGQAWWCLVDGQGEMTSVGVADITLADGDVYGFVYTVG